MVNSFHDKYLEKKEKDRKMKVTIYFSGDPDLYQKIHQLAKWYGLSVSSYIRILLKKVVRSEYTNYLKDEQNSGNL